MLFIETLSAIVTPGETLPPAAFKNSPNEKDLNLITYTLTHLFDSTCEVIEHVDFIVDDELVVLQTELG